jgi:hypothetical protein
LKELVDKLGGKVTADLTINNTHLIYLPPSAPLSTDSAESSEFYDRAAQLNIPIVSHKWLESCVENRGMQRTTEFFVRKPIK